MHAKRQGTALASMNCDMTNTTITLDGVSCVLPDGSPLFSDLSDTLDHRRTGLVGRNGVGKSRLADRKSTRLNSSHSQISYAVFCLKKKKYRRIGSKAADNHEGSNDHDYTRAKAD